MTYPIEIFPVVMNVIDAVRRGKTLTRACFENYTTPSTVKKYCAEHAELQSAFDDAVLEGYDTLAEALIDIQTDAIHGTSDAKMAQVKSSNIKWYLARRRPELYGEKVEHVHTLSVDQTIIEALNAGKIRAGLIEDVAYSVVEEPAALPAPSSWAKALGF